MASGGAKNELPVKIRVREINLPFADKRHDFTNRKGVYDALKVPRLGLAQKHDFVVGHERQKHGRVNIFDSGD